MVLIAVNQSLRRDDESLERASWKGDFGIWLWALSFVLCALGLLGRCWHRLRVIVSSVEMFVAEESRQGVG